jgi:hypothetical protein
MEVASERPWAAGGLLARAGGCIDTHHHVIPPGYAAWLSAKGWQLPVPTWSPEAALAAMDRHGVDMAIVSLSTPGLFRASLHEARRLARQFNQFCADVTRARPDRFGFGNFSSYFVSLCRHSGTASGNSYSWWPAHKGGRSGPKTCCPEPVPPGLRLAVVAGRFRVQRAATPC